MTKERVGLVGDRVVAKGHTGAFVISAIDALHRAATLAKIGGPKTTLTVGWRDVQFLYGSDSSQNALRVVREATESR